MPWSMILLSACPSEHAIGRMWGLSASARAHMSRHGPHRQASAQRRLTAHRRGGADPCGTAQRPRRSRAANGRADPSRRKSRVLSQHLARPPYTVLHLGALVSELTNQLDIAAGSAERAHILRGMELDRGMGLAGTVNAARPSWPRRTRSSSFVVPTVPGVGLEINPHQRPPPVSRSSCRPGRTGTRGHGSRG